MRRADKPRRAELYPIKLCERLPNIRIPLRSSDADIFLQLQPLIDRCYESGRYDKIDYRRPPHPPLDPNDERWADALLREQRRR